MRTQTAILGMILAGATPLAAGISTALIALLSRRTNPKAGISILVLDGRWGIIPLEVISGSDDTC